jgi:pimeloyl-ACP methyl ester carboxylesterase
MRIPSQIRRIALFLTVYLVFCSIAGVFVADGALHPARRPLPPEAESAMRQVAADSDAELQDVSITASDGMALRAWAIQPHHTNGNAVILFHGLGDNRLGMTGYGQLLLRHAFAVLLPDARAHGISGGEVATYGLLERNDIHRWFDWLAKHSHPRCIFGFGESMGGAQLLQSLASGTHFCAVVAESSFSNFREIAYDRMGQPFHLGPWVGRTILRPIVEVAFLRARWKYNLNMQAISPEDSLAAAKVPVFLIHGQIDSNIPIRHSRRMHASNPPTTLWEVPNADHCGAISAAQQEFEQHVLRWFSDHSSQMY